MNRYQLRSTDVALRVPTTDDLLVGEFGVNLVDGKLFINYGGDLGVVDVNAADQIEQDATHRFVTDAQIAAWNAASGGGELPIATADAAGIVQVGTGLAITPEGLLSVNLGEASGSQAGLLSAADWTTFNGKQNALGFTPVNVAGDTMTGALTLFGNPVAGLDAAPKQYVDAAIASLGGAYAAPVQTEAELAALNSTDLLDKQIRLVEDEGAIYRYDSQADDEAAAGIVVPDDAPANGRWFRVGVSGGGVTDHEALTGLQGGAPGDHQHLTTAEKSAINSHLADTDAHLSTSERAWLSAITASAVEINAVAGLTDELGFLSGVTSSIQTQLDAKIGDGTVLNGGTF